VIHQSASCRGAALVPGSNVEARGHESRRVRAKITVVAVVTEVNQVIENTKEKEIPRNCAQTAAFHS
jgi:hypothetical protein